MEAPKLIKQNSNSLTDNDKIIMFEMYKNSYRDAGEKLWFETYQQLFNQ